jgi:hypothetical protein
VAELQVASQGFNAKLRTAVEELEGTARHEFRHLSGLHPEDRTMPLQDAAQAAVVAGLAGAVNALCGGEPQRVAEFAAGLLKQAGLNTRVLSTEGMREARTEVEIGRTPIVVTTRPDTPEVRAEDARADAELAAEIAEDSFRAPEALAAMGPRQAFESPATGPAAPSRPASEILRALDRAAGAGPAEGFPGLAD